MASSWQRISADAKKRFLPLAADETGRKGATGSFENETIEMFCYYKETDWVGGDYVDFRKLDDRFYAVIFSDAAGASVPAFFMTHVITTLFSDFCFNWSRKPAERRIDRLLYRIKEAILQQFRDRYAAVLMALIAVRLK